MKNFILLLLLAFSLNSFANGNEKISGPVLVINENETDLTVYLQLEDYEMYKAIKVTLHKTINGELITEHFFVSPENIKEFEKGMGKVTSLSKQFADAKFEVVAVNNNGELAYYPALELTGLENNSNIALGGNE